MFRNDIDTAAGTGAIRSGPIDTQALAGRIFRLPDPQYALGEVERRYGDRAEAIDRRDGLTMAFGDWRFTLRPTEERALSLAVESQHGHAAVERRSAEMAGLLASC